MADSVHPVQAIATTQDHVVTASNAQLAVFDAATTAFVARASHHKALVRLIAPYVDSKSGKRYLISTGEDKLLVVSALPSLDLLSSRELPKRANALDVTSQGDIVVGDKFGDVYIFPLDAPVVPEGTKPEDVPKPQPILGHVSMLNTLALIPADPQNGLTRDWIATGDRDEHVRISRYPQGHVIEKFGWGSKAFVSALLYIPAPPASSSSAPSSSDPPYLLSAGADSTIQVFALPSAELVARFPVQDLLFPYLAVGPEAPAPILPGRKKNKLTPRDKEKGKGAETEEGTPAAEEEQADEQAQDDELRDVPTGGRELTKGLAVVKLVAVGPSSRTDGGVVVLAAGSTALLFIPYSLLLPTSATAPTDTPATAATPSLVSFAHPILDLAPAPVPSHAGSRAEFLLSLDTSRPSPLAPSSSSSSADAAAAGEADAAAASPAPTPVVRVALSAEGQLAALPTLTTDAVFLSSACAPHTAKGGRPPSVASLYPALQLLHHPGDEEFAGPAPGAGAGEGGAEGEGAAEALAARGVGDGKPKGGRGIKRGAPAPSVAPSEAGEWDGHGRRVGKRAIGRAETLRRYEEAKRKMLQPGGADGTTLTEGERAAVREMEDEADEASKKQGAEMEGAKVA